MSKIMAINAGSSSLKFQLFEMPTITNDEPADGEGI